MITPSADSHLASAWHKTNMSQLASTNSYICQYPEKNVGFVNHIVWCNCHWIHTCVCFVIMHNTVLKKVKWTWMKRIHTQSHWARYIYTHIHSTKRQPWNSSGVHGMLRHLSTSRCGFRVIEGLSSKVLMQLTSQEYHLFPIYTLVTRGSSRRRKNKIMFFFRIFWKQHSSLQSLEVYASFMKFSQQRGLRG